MRRKIEICKYLRSGIHRYKIIADYVGCGQVSKVEEISCTKTQIDLKFSVQSWSIQ